MSEYVRIYIAPGMYAVDNLTIAPPDGWVPSETGYCTNDPAAFIALVLLLAHYDVFYTTLPHPLFRAS